MRFKATTRSARAKINPFAIVQNGFEQRLVNHHGMYEANKIYFISGVSGVGKSSTLKHLKEALPSNKYDVRDLDERGVADGGGLEWLNNDTRYWLDVAKENALAGKDTIICGFA